VDEALVLFPVRGSRMIERRRVIVATAFTMPKRTRQFKLRPQHGAARRRLQGAEYVEENACGDTPQRPQSLAGQLLDYAACWPLEAPQVALFNELLNDPADAFQRERAAGHFTAGAWLISADGLRLLMTHHRKLGRWLQLGGHADGERDMAAVALKEAQEESGLEGLVVDGDAIFDLDRHWIPERRDVPGHWHYDVRYVVRAGADENCLVSDESHDLAWRPIADLANDPDESLARMARKWLGFSFSPREKVARSDG